MYFVTVNTIPIINVVMAIVACVVVTCLCATLKLFLCYFHLNISMLHKLTGNMFYIKSAMLQCLPFVFGHLYIRLYFVLQLTSQHHETLKQTLLCIYNVYPVYCNIKTTNKHRIIMLITTFNQ